MPPKPYYYIIIYNNIIIRIEYLQYVTYSNPNISEDYYIVIDYITYNDPAKPTLILKNLNSGEELKVRIKQASVYKANPFGQFSILKIEGFTQDFKKEKVNGEWKTTDQIEYVLECYDVIKN